MAQDEEYEPTDFEIDLVKIEVDLINKKIKQLLSEGKTVAQIAEEVGQPEKYVMNVLSCPKCGGTGRYHCDTEHPDDCIGVHPCDHEWHS